MTQAARPKGRILYVCNDGFYFRQHRQHLALRLVREGYDVHVACDGDQGATDAVTYHHIGVERFRFDPWRDLALALQIRRLLKRLRPDIVHLITMKPIVVTAAALSLPSPVRLHRPQKMVATFPGLGRLFEGRSRLEKMRRHLVEVAVRVFFKDPTTVATFENASDRVMFIHHGIVPASRAILTAGAGLDLERFSASQDDQVRPFRALWASRLLRSKGLEPFLEAAARSRASGSPTEFWVAGYADPGHADSLSRSEREALEANPAICYLGHVTDMPALFRQVDALVLPSRYNEGLPRILIEAAAAGRVLIGSDIPGIRAIIEHGVTGLLLADSSAEEVLAAVASLAGDRLLARQLGEAARAFVWSRGFSQKDVQASFLRVYGLEPG